MGSHLFKEYNMKNTLIVLSFISIGMAPLFAQSSNRYDLGLEVGPNVSIFSGKTGNNHSSLHPDYGSTISLAFQWNSRKNFSFRTGFIFEQNNCSYTSNYADAGTSYGGSGTGIAQYEYLKLPLLARFTFGKKIQLFFNAGVFFSLLTKQIEKTEGTNYYTIGFTTNSYTYKNEYSDISSYKKVDFGLAAGLGIGLPFKKRWYFSLEARDHFGVSNIYSAGNSIRTHSLNLLLGISYKLGFREKNEL
jgi:hypothetical protein